MFFDICLNHIFTCSMRGVKSEGMVLAATGENGTVELLEPPKGSEPGERIFFEGYDQTASPDPVLNPKKKVWETIQPGLFTDNELVAKYRKTAIDDDSGGSIHTMLTHRGIITVSSVTGASIK